MPPVPELLTFLVLGLVSGALGGLLGIGGSIIIIPILTLVLGPNQHLYQATAMIVNVFVALPATYRHTRAGAVRWDVVLKMLPPGLVLVVLGVMASDTLQGDALQRMFGVFLIYVIYVNVIKLWENAPEPRRAEQRATWPRAGFVGGFMGFIAGLLGIGGGIITVPLLQRVCNLPLRQCIACSSTVMCLTAVVGAARKNLSDQVVLSDSLIIAACLAPTALLGGLLGAGLTHAIPLRWIRVAFIVLMIVACAKMLGAF